MLSKSTPFISGYVYNLCCTSYIFCITPNRKMLVLCLFKVLLGACFTADFGVLVVRPTSLRRAYQNFSLSLPLPLSHSAVSQSLGLASHFLLSSPGHSILVPHPFLEHISHAPAIEPLHFLGLPMALFFPSQP